MRRRLGVWAALVGLLVMPASAFATFPGANGKIAFVQGGDIWAINPNGSDLVQITSGPDAEASPAWSPDGSTIAFSRRSAPSADEEAPDGLGWLESAADQRWL